MILRDDETLVAKNLGVTGEQEQVVVTRANPTNVLFVNESAEDRRLVLDLGTRAEIDEETGDTLPDTEVPAQVCTQLVEEGGSQLLTFSIVTRERGRRRAVPVLRAGRRRRRARGARTMSAVARRHADPSPSSPR